MFLIYANNWFSSNWNRNQLMKHNIKHNLRIWKRLYKGFTCFATACLKSMKKKIEQNVWIFNATIQYYYYFFRIFRISDIWTASDPLFFSLPDTDRQLYTNIRTASDTVNQVIKMDQIWLSIFYENFKLTKHSKMEKLKERKYEKIINFSMIRRM